MQSIEVACVGCGYIPDNIINWKMDIDIQSLEIKLAPVEVDPTALGVFMEGSRVGFIPRDDKARVLEFGKLYKGKGKKKVEIKKVQSHIDDPGIVTWFEFRITIE